MAISLNNIEIIELLIKSKLFNLDILENNETLLHKAVLLNNFNLVQILVKNNASPNVKDFDGHTALHLAAIHGYEDIFHFLC